MNPYEHHRRHRLGIPFECNGFAIDDYVQYEKDNSIHQAYIYCFREYGYNWFAYLYKDKDSLKTIDNMPVDKLKKLNRKYNNY